MEGRYVHGISCIITLPEVSKWCNWKWRDFNNLHDCFGHLSTFFSRKFLYAYIFISTDNTIILYLYLYLIAIIVYYAIPNITKPFAHLHRLWFKSWIEIIVYGFYVVHHKYKDCNIKCKRRSTLPSRVWR